MAAWSPAAMRAAQELAPQSQLSKTTCRASCQNRASYLAAALRSLTSLAADVQHVRYTRLLLSGIYARVSRVSSPTCPESVPLTQTSSIRRDASHFVFPASFACKCITYPPFSCLHGEDGAGRFGRPGGVPVGIRGCGCLHCGEVRDAKSGLRK